MRRHLTVFSSWVDLTNYAEQMEDHGAFLRLAANQLIWKSGLVEDLRVITAIEEAWTLAGRQYTTVIYRISRKTIPGMVVNYLSGLVRESTHATV